MRDTQPSFFVGLDVGTSMVRCVVGTLGTSADEPSLSVVGHGQAPNTGMRKGLIAHVDEVAGAINQAVTEAERMAGIRISSATVNVNGVHVSGMDSKGVIAISSANREITDDDKLRVEEAATIVQIPSNREIIQVFPKNYRVDGHDNIKDPRGMRGVRLEVDTHIVTASTPNLHGLDAVLDKVNIKPSHHTVSGLASAEVVMSRNQKEAGTLVLDIGASTTNMAIIEDGEVQHVAVIPMGGTNITNDLAIGLKTDLDIAELVKIKHAAVSGHAKKGSVSVQVDNRNHVFDAEELTMITEARIEEIFEFVEKELKKVHKSRKLPGGVVIVGGTANIPGIAHLAKEKLGLASRIGKTHPLGGIAEDLQGPSFVTVIGLMELDLLLQGQGDTPMGNSGGVDGVFGAISNFWQKVKN